MAILLNSESGIQFSNVTLPGVTTGNKRTNSTYKDKSTGNDASARSTTEISEPTARFVNAIDIDWNGAEWPSSIPSAPTIINTTGDLINAIKYSANAPHSHNNYLTAHQNLSHSHTQYITTVGTGLSKSGQTISLKQAAIVSGSSPRVLGGILPYNAYNYDMLNYIQNIVPNSSNNNYGITMDANGLAFVGLPEFSLTSHSHGNYLTSLAHSHSQYATTGHSHSQYLTAHQSLSHSHTEYITTNGTGLSKSGQTLSLKAATTTEIGGIKLSYVDPNSDYTNYTSLGGVVKNIFVSGSSNVYQNYGLQKGTDDNVFVNVPWTETTVQYNTTNKTIDATIRRAGASGPELTTTSISASQIVTDGGGLLHIKDQVNADSITNGAYSYISSGITNWITTRDAQGPSLPGIAFGLGNLQIAVDGKGRLYSRKNDDRRIWQVVNQLETIDTNDVVDCNTLIYPAVLGFCRISNGPIDVPDTDPFTIFVFTSSDYDVNGFRSILQIAINRYSGAQYVRFCFKRVDGSNDDFINCGWSRINSGNTGVTQLSGLYKIAINNGDITAANNVTWSDINGISGSTATSSSKGLVRAATDAEETQYANQQYYTLHVNSNGLAYVTGVAKNDHNHDDRYYTETEINTKLDAKADKSSTVTNVSWNGSTLQKTINGTATNVVTASSIVASGINTDSAKPTVTDEGHGDGIIRTFGAIKVAVVKPETPTLQSYAYVDSGDTSVKYYGVQTDQNGLAFVQIPVSSEGISEVTAENHYTSPAGAKSSGLYKITTDAAGHITAATAVTRDDIVSLLGNYYSLNSISPLFENGQNAYIFAGFNSDGTLNNHTLSSLTEYEIKQAPLTINAAEYIEGHLAGSNIEVHASDSDQYAIIAWPQKFGYLEFDDNWNKAIGTVSTTYGDYYWKSTKAQNRIYPTVVIR